jgi:imidazolonepropionase-like amidohydrolase
MLGSLSRSVSSLAALAALAASSLGLAIGCSGDDGPTPTRIGCDGCTVLTGGMVFDGTSAGLGAVALRDGAIEQVAYGPVTVEAGEVIDVSGRTVLPGLFDMHEHSRGDGAPYGYFSDASVTETNDKARLRSGVTSILDVGSPARMIFEHRARLRDGRVLGPNLFAAGPLVTAHGGHPCRNGSPGGDYCVFIDDAADVATELPPLLAQEPDVIKVVIEAGTPEQPLPRLSDDAVHALGAAARADGLRMIAHVSTSADVELALDAGILLFAHIPGEDRIDRALADRLVREGAVIVPTLAVYDSLARISTGTLEDLDASDITDDVPLPVLAAFEDPALLAYMTAPETQALYAGWRENALANFRTCLEAGVTMVAGTDAGNPGTFHGRALRRELALYVENGMSPIDALAAATREPADVLGRSDLGRLEPGAIADLLIVDGDATSDIAALGSVHAVYRAGRALDLAGLSVRSDSSLVIAPSVDLAAGATCLGEGECGDRLYCGWQSVCAATCGTAGGCATGSACFPQASGTEGFCYPGDGCDPLAQGCANGEACIWLGNGATLCWYAAEPIGGEPCSALGVCAPGHQCDFTTSRCVELCDPRRTDGCSGGRTCRDRSAEAGVTVGECG